MKKFIQFVCVAIACASFTACGAETVEGTKKAKESPLGFTEAELIGTVKEVQMVNTDKNLQFLTVRLDGKPAPSHFFTDEKVKVGDRVVIYLVVRLNGSGVAWVKVRPFTQ